MKAYVWICLFCVVSFSNMSQALQELLHFQQDAERIVLREGGVPGNRVQQKQRHPARGLERIEKMKKQWAEEREPEQQVNFWGVFFPRLRQILQAQGADDQAVNDLLATLVESLQRRLDTLIGEARPYQPLPDAHEEEKRMVSVYHVLECLGRVRNVLLDDDLPLRDTIHSAVIRLAHAVVELIKTPFCICSDYANFTESREQKLNADRKSVPQLETALMALKQRCDQATSEAAAQNKQANCALPEA